MKNKTIQMQGTAVFNKLNCNDSDVEADNDTANEDNDMVDFSFNNSELGNSNIQSEQKSLAGNGGVTGIGVSAGGVTIGFVITVLLMVLIGISVANYMTTLETSGSSTAEHCPASEDGLDPASFQQYEVSAWNGTVATDVYECSKIGGDILFAGGNAIDAAIAAAFCLGVLSPASSGIGGGCMMVLYNASIDSAVFMDSREVAPAAATPTMFVDGYFNYTDELEPSLNGGLAIGVLAELKGLHLAYQQHGSGNIPWAQLVAPAVELAKSWIINENVGNSLRNIQEHLLSGEYPELSALYTKPQSDSNSNSNRSTTIKVMGDSVEQPLLSQTLANIALYGSDFIYKNMSAAIAQDIQEAGGIITQADIEGYEPRMHAPVTTNVLGYTYYGASGASSGGATVAGILAFMDSHLEPLAGLPRAAYEHLYAEASSHAFAVRF